MGIGKNELLDTGDKILANSQRHDMLWGTGWSRTDKPYCELPRQWKGKNLLGFALMVVREQLKDQSNSPVLSLNLAADQPPAT